MDRQEITQIVERQRAYFRSHATLGTEARCDALRRLLAAVRTHEHDIEAALQADLGKCADEAFMCEIGTSLAEIRYQIKHLERWARPQRVRGDLANFPSRCYTQSVPYGVVLIMAPWNYPFLLTLEPLAGALAAGNTVVLKPSAYAPESSRVLRELVEEAFDERLVRVVEGGRAENTALLEERWDSIFFTGSVEVGKLVMERASRNLTPVTLELGGKSPCIVDATANLRLAARRIAFGKWLNVGQTCVAPDYLLIDRTVKDKFLVELERAVRAMYGRDALANEAYGKIVNAKHFERVRGLIDPAKVVFGGKADPLSLKIEPTVMDGVCAEDAVMQEEIFGPILPVIAFDAVEEAEAFITARPTPLALYIFSEDRAVQQRFVQTVPFGGGCVNDTIMHLATSHMGFGGMGASGMGLYHGRESFDTFSHKKSIVEKSTRLDPPIRYTPHSPVKRAVTRLLLG